VLTAVQPPLSKAVIIAPHCLPTMDTMTENDYLLAWGLYAFAALPVFLPGESQEQGSLVGCRLWGRTELDTTEAT